MTRLTLALGCLIAMGCQTIPTDPISFANLQPRGEVTFKLYVLDAGRITCRDASILHSSLEAGQPLLLANPVFLVVHPRGTLVWDTGLPDSISSLESGLEINEGQWNYRLPVTLASQFAELGMDAASIDYLAFSHFHNDHTGNAPTFENATLILQGEAFDSAFGDSAASLGFDPSHYRNFHPDRILKTDGSLDVFGDRSVVILPTPGHAPGHQVLFLDLPQTGPILLSGDLYITQDNRERGWIPEWNDREQTLQSFEKVEQLLQRTGTELWIQHDWDQFEARKRSPEFYD